MVQATIDYTQPHVTSKFVVGLNAALPVEAAATVGWNGFVAGGKAFVDVRSSRVSNYSLACAYLGPNFVATGHATEKFGKITGSYWQKVDIMSSVAAEVVHDTTSNDVALTMGYSHIEADGALPLLTACCLLVRTPAVSVRLLPVVWRQCRGSVCDAPACRSCYKRPLSAIWCL
jgi:hypothetical protein